MVYIWLMNTLLLTTPQARIAADAFRDLEPNKLTNWNVETLPSGSIGNAGSIPTVLVVQVGDNTSPAQIKALISKLALIQPGVPQGAFVLFALKRQAQQALQQVRAQRRRMQAIMDEINLSLSEFPNPDRVDVIEYVPDLLTKLSLIETKLKIAPPRPSPLDKVKEALQATGDLRVANGNLSAAAVADSFEIALSHLANWLGRTRQALNKTPDADSLQDELAFFERVARLRAVVSKDQFLKWLRMPNSALDNKKPLDLLATGRRQVVADLVDDMLTGAPA